MPPEPALPGITARRAMFRCMLGLVLANVLFVQLTGAASPISLSGLLIATVAAPILRRFRDRRWYGIAWNLAAFGALGVLVSHATGGQLSRLLEDGLVLALLCQVHLLNNLRDEHRPDLLFINAFLIAIITGYITADLGFAVAFFGFVPVFVAGLGFMSIAAHGKTRLAEGDVRRILRDALGRSAVLVVATGAVFLVWPRNFEREALLTRYFELPEPGSTARVDFAEELRLERLAGSDAKARLALTLELREGGPASPPTLWRGALLGEVSRSGDWTEGPDTGDFREAPWTVSDDGLSMARPGDPRWTVHVTRHGGGTRRLFLPAGAVSVTLDEAHSAGRLEVRQDGAVSYSNPGRLGYTVEIAPEPPPGAAAPQVARTVERSLHTTSAVGLARALRRAGSPPTAVGEATRFSAELQRRYPYQPPGAEGAAGTLHEFLTTDSGGHCELFASALAVMTRSEGFAARVATGYRTEPVPAQGKLDVMSTSAHAWVEVLDEDASRWVSVDPTPAAEAAGNADDGGFLADAKAAMASAWAKVTGFDGAQRAALLGWLRRHGILLAAGLGLGLAAIHVRRRRNRHVEVPSVLELRASLRACGIELGPGETVREALDRARSTPRAVPDVLAALELAAARHEADRYAA